MTIPVEYLVVAGGGGGKPAVSGAAAGIGGGAGGLLAGTGYDAATGVALTVTVGAGGASNTNGSNSVFDTFTATGGGTGNTAGGSGGGKIYSQAAPGAAGTSGQGYAGGAGSGSYTGGTYYPSGGGGGAGGVGGNGNNNNTAGTGGPGVSNSISGSAVVYAGGGGGACYGGGTPGYGDLGGGGGGAGAYPSTVGGDGTDGLGGGGGGGGSPNYAGGAGGDGIVILKYADTYPVASSTTGSPSYSVSGGYRTYTWTTVGSWSITLDAGSAINETFTETVAAGLSLDSAGTFNETLTASVAVSASAVAPETYNETIAASVAVDAVFGEYDPRTRLLLKFNEASGATTVADTSSYGRTATFSLYSVTDTQGVFSTNSAIVGNPGGTATLSHVSVANPEDLFSFGEKPRQFDLWYRMYGFPITQSVQPVLYIEFTNGDYIELDVNTTTLAAYYDGDTFLTASAAFGYSANTWRHYRVVIDGATMKVGCNGAEIASVTHSWNIWTGGVSNVPVDVRFGNNGTNLAQGYIDAIEVKEGAGLWAGGTYTVPAVEPIDAWYQSYDNWTDAGAMQAVVDAGFASVMTFSNTTVISAGVSLSFADSGGTIIEYLSFSVSPRAAVSSTGTFNVEASFSVVLDSGMFGSKAYAETMTCSVALASGQVGANDTDATLSESVSLGASFAGVPSYAGVITAGVALDMTAVSTQTHISSASFSIGLLFQSVDESRLDATESTVMLRPSESFVFTES